MPMRVVGSSLEPGGLAQEFFQPGVPDPQEIPLENIFLLSQAATIAAFTQTATLVNKPGISQSATLAAFTQTAAYKVLVSLAESATLPAFSQTATYKDLVSLSQNATIPAFGANEVFLPVAIHITGAQTVAPFTATQTIVHLSEIIQLATLAAFTQTATYAVTVKLAQGATLAAFTQTARVAVLNKLSANQTIPDFTATEQFGLLAKLSASQILNAFEVNQAIVTEQRSISQDILLPAFGRTETFHKPHFGRGVDKDGRDMAVQARLRRSV